MIQSYLDWAGQDGIRMFWVLLIGSSIAFLVATSLTRFMRRGSASSRFLVWKWGFLCVLTIPLTQLAIPGVPQINGFLSPDRTPAVASREPGENERIDKPFVDFNEEPVVASHAKPFPANQNNFVGDTTNKRTESPLLTTPTTAVRFAWLGIGIVSVWLIGIVFMFCRLSLSHWQVRQLIAQCHAGELLGKPALFHDQLDVPVAVGIIRPRILMPSHSIQWVPSALRMVLAHETAHVMRNDVFWQFVVSVSKCFVWFQPLAWFANRQMKLEREIACDNHVLSEGVNAVEYAEALLALTRKLHTPRMVNEFALQAFEKPIERRVVSILANNVRRSRPSWLLSALLGVLFTLGWVCFAVAVAPENVKWDDPATPGPDVNTSNWLSSSELQDKDFVGDELPDGAVARLGAMRYRHQGWNKSFYFLSDSKRFISCGDRGPIARVWDVATGKLLQELGNGDPYLTSYCIPSPVGKTVATLTSRLNQRTREMENMISLWQTDGWEKRELTSWTNPQQEHTNRLVFTPDGSKIVAFGNGFTIRVFDVASGELVLEQKMPERSIRLIAVSTDSTQMAIVTSYYSMFIWDWQSDNEPRKLEAVPKSIEFLEYLPDGRLVLGSRRSDAAASIWNVNTGMVVANLGIGNAGSQDRYGVALSADGKQLIANNKGKMQVEFYDLETYQLVRTLNTNHTGGHVAISRDGRYLVSGGQGAEIQAWDLEKDELLNKEYIGHQDLVSSIQFSSDGKRVLTGSTDGSARLWNAESGEQLNQFSHDGGVKAAQLLDERNVIVSTSFDDTLRVWDAQTGREQLKVKGHGITGGGDCIGFNSETNRIVSFGENDRILRTRSLDDGRQLAEFLIKFEFESKPANARMENHLFRPRINTRKGLLLAALKTDLYMFDLETGKRTQLHQFDNQNFVYAMLPETEQFLTVEPVVFDGQPRQARMTIRDAKSNFVDRETMIPAYAYNIGLSPDGSLAAISMAFDKTGDRGHWVSVRDVESLKEVARLERLSGQVMSLAIAADNRRLALSYSDTPSVTIWDLNRFRTK